MVVPEYVRYLCRFISSYAKVPADAGRCKRIRRGCRGKQEGNYVGKRLPLRAVIFRHRPNGESPPIMADNI
jgi:hypothetical protein